MCIRTSRKSELWSSFATNNKVKDAEIIKDKTLILIPNYDKQNHLFCILGLLVDKFGSANQDFKKYTQFL